VIAPLLVLLAASAAVATDTTEPQTKTPASWRTKPSASQLLGAWPAEALAKHIEGKVQLNCAVTTAGQADDCKVVSETPAGLGFGSAALLLTPTFLFNPARDATGPIVSRVNIPINFNMAAAETPDPPFKTPPSWLRKPTASQLFDAWPAVANAKRIEGRAELNCRVNVEGLAEDCKVVSEEPSGFGFGNAALLLAPTLLFNPARNDSGPVPSHVNIPINFKGDEVWKRSSGPGIAATTEVLEHPVWSAAPTFADLGAAYPKHGEGRAFYVAFRCDIENNGSLANCDVKQSEPRDGGAEAAARTLIRRFRLDPKALGDRMLLRPRTDVAIRLIDPSSAEFRERRIAEPLWVAVVDPNSTPGIYPPQAAAKSIPTGVGIATCHVDADGTLSGCVPGKANPEGFGFSESAVKVAAVMRMRIWTQGGGPVDGAVINIPIRLNLSKVSAAAASAPPTKSPGE
jgi:TonB family protein